MSSFLKTILGLGCLIIIFFGCCIGSCILLTVFSAKFTEDTYAGKYGFEEVVTKVSNKPNSEKIAIVNISGEITYSLPSSKELPGASSNNIIRQLQQAESDPKVKTIILRLNTPGGEVDAGIPICNEIKRIKTHKDIYAFVDSQAASLGYLIANCATSIYARPTAITGSIGVIIQAVDFYGVLEKFGGKVVYVTNSNGKNKGGQQIFDQNSETYKIYQKILDEDYDLFLNIVTEGRKGKLTKDQLKQYADGRIFSGSQALQNKLVDETGEYIDVLTRVAKKENLDLEETDIVEYSIKANPFSDLFGALNLIDNKNKSSLKALMILNVSEN